MINIDFIIIDLKRRTSLMFCGPTFKSGKTKGRHTDKHLTLFSSCTWMSMREHRHAQWLCLSSTFYRDSHAWLWNKLPQKLQLVAPVLSHFIPKRILIYMFMRKQTICLQFFPPIYNQETWTSFSLVICVWKRDSVGLSEPIIYIQNIYTQHTSIYIDLYMQSLVSVKGCLRICRFKHKFQLLYMLFWPSS